MPKINGVKGAYLQPTRYGRDESGLYTIFVWEGTKNEVLSNVPAIESVGGLWEMEESFTQAKCRLTGRFPTNPNQQEQTVDTWELFSNTVEKDLLESDIAFISTMDQDVKRIIREAIDNPQPGKSPALTNSSQIDLYLLMLSGVKAVEVDQPVLRHTVTASNVYQVPNSLTNVGRILTTARLKNDEAIRADIAINLPNVASSDSRRTYGWRKCYPQIRGSAFQRTVVEQEWKYGLWVTSPAIYTVLT